MEWVFVVWIISIVVGAIVGSQKGSAGISVFLTFILGPLGLLLVLVMQGNRKQCPKCKKYIHNEAEICPYCRSSIELQTTETIKDIKVDPLTLKKKKTNTIISLIAITVFLILIIVALASTYNYGK